MKSLYIVLVFFRMLIKKHSGGYGVGVPPLPIPNREVKPDCADGTAYKWESR